MPTTTQELADLSGVIGELRNFASQQVVTNAHVLEQLKSISDRINSIGETGVVLAEYRHTLHERFNKIHETLGELEHKAENHTTALHKLEMVQNAWQSNIKMIIAISWVVCTVMSAILSAYGASILRAIVK